MITKIDDFLSADFSETVVDLPTEKQTPVFRSAVER